ncbi:MAG: SGNH/GDSL hydrolase family protein [Planctomycetes bacterium]|nr:SGNH/GDSL hydrolase family protein [Planctomycetota bacterium]
MNILELPEAKDFFSGILKLEKCETGWMTQRFTEKQLEYYSNRSEGAMIRARCSAGVILQIQTDSPWLDLEFESLGGARKYLGIDIEVDGKVIKSFREDEFEGTFSEGPQDLGSCGDKSSRKVKVYFTYAMITRLKRIEIADGSEYAPVSKPDKKLLCLGDSITQGMSTISPLSAYTTQLGRLLGAEMLNQGVGGHVFDADSLDQIENYRPDYITVAYGTNDWKKGLTRKEIRANVEAYLEKLQTIYAGSPVWIISPIWRSIGNEAMGEEGMKLDEFSAVIRETANTFENVSVIDGLTLVPHQEMYFKDGTHPDELGFMHYAVNLYKAMGV